MLIIFVAQIRLVINPIGLVLETDGPLYRRSL